REEHRLVRRLFIRSPAACRSSASRSRVAGLPLFGNADCKMQNEEWNHVAAEVLHSAFCNLHSFPIPHSLFPVENHVRPRTNRTHQKPDAGATYRVASFAETNLFDRRPNR